MKRLFCLVLVLLGVSLYAGDAKRCISVGYHDSQYGSSSDSQTLKNNCSYKIEVVWCHNNNAKKYKSGRCGKGGKYYQKHAVLKAGEVKQNQYSLPKSGRINYGACKGGYYSTITKKWNDGTYQCKNR